MAAVQQRRPWGLVHSDAFPFGKARALLPVFEAARRGACWINNLAAPRAGTPQTCPQQRGITCKSGVRELAQRCASTRTAKAAKADAVAGAVTPGQPNHASSIAPSAAPIANVNEHDDERHGVEPAACHGLQTVDDALVHS
jgi:hypothetical protein